MKLNDKLKKINTYPFHMPGHKRNQKYNIIGSDIDITEIYDFDNLHSPTGILNELQERCANVFNVNKSIFSVNGSTCCILAAISAVCNQGDKIIIARNCHKSVYNACFINKLDVRYIEPEFNEKFNTYTNITQYSVDEVVKENPDAKAVVITSPTYEGVISNIKCRIPLIVDAAHGAHFGFDDRLPSRANADIIIESLHKTLPCLTQCAVVHINNASFYDDVKKYMDIFETSSPSYVLLASIEKCISVLESTKDEFDNLFYLINTFKQKIKNNNLISLMDNDDPTRLVIAVKGYTGTQLSDYLRTKSIEVEGATLNYVILISTIGDTEQGFELLYNALSAIVEVDDNCCLKNEIYRPVIPEKICNSYEVVDSQLTSLALSSGKTCAEYVYAYPPGVPVLVPGEKINSQIVDYIKKSIENNINILSDKNLLPDFILTKTDK